MTAFKSQPLTTGPLGAEVRGWERWMDSMAEITQRFDRFGDDPLAYNETASVSALTAAAAASGMLALAEFSSRKRSREQKGQSYNGRADLWVATERLGWSLEFKQWLPEVRPVGLRRLGRLLDDAEDCAGRVHARAADHVVAGLIINTWWADSGVRRRTDENIREFALQQERGRKAFFAWRIGASSHRSPSSYLLFRWKRKAWRTCR